MTTAKDTDLVLHRKINRAFERGIAPIDMHKRARDNKCILCGAPAAYTGNWCALCDNDYDAKDGGEVVYAR